MNINKAIKKQKKSLRRFTLNMGFIFLLLPTVMYFTNMFRVFFVLYLILIELLIILSIVVKIDKTTLKYNINENLKIQDGILGGRYVIPYKKVEFVHTINEGKDLKIIIILRSKLRNEKIKIVGPKFLKRNKWIQKYYYNLKNKSVFNQCYYMVINRGGHLKYELLNLIYKYCVNAYFTENSIKRIKEYRK